MNLKQLSQHLGLSQTTVSRALNGFPEVGETTRRRVIEAAERYTREQLPQVRAAFARAGVALPMAQLPTARTPVADTSR